MRFNQFVFFKLPTAEYITEETHHKLYICKTIIACFLSSSKTIKFQKDFDHLDKVISLNLLIFCYYLLYCFILAVKVKKENVYF